jgi:hypothetical protein
VSSLKVLVEPLKIFADALNLFGNILKDFPHSQYVAGIGRKASGAFFAIFSLEKLCLKTRVSALSSS